jgi:chaperonin GroEL (HSP60 family)
MLHLCDKFKSNDPDEVLGAKIVQQAVSAPLQFIAENAALMVLLLYIS